jgi:hypothetical protein
MNNNLLESGQETQVVKPKPLKPNKRPVLSILPSRMFVKIHNGLDTVKDLRSFSLLMVLNFSLFLASLMPSKYLEEPSVVMKKECIYKPSKKTLKIVC